MPDYKTTEEYWAIVDRRYSEFAKPEDKVEVSDSYRASGKCDLCGHEIVNHFEIINRRTGEIIVVGSNCVDNRLEIARKWWDRIKAQKKAEQEKFQAVMAG